MFYELGTERLNRRIVICGCLSVFLPSIGRAATAPPSGTVGLICTRRGIAGVLFKGEAGALLSPDSQWHIGSNTKALTAALYARLVDQQRCRWDAVVPSLFPSLAVHPGWADVRVEELLSHSAGLTDGIVDSAWLSARHKDDALPREQRRLLVKRILAGPPEGKRGSYRYGNLNYVLIGAAIEEAVNSSWEETMHAELFEPLGMRDVGFGAPPRTGPWGREGSGSTLRPVDPAGIADNPAVLWPSGGVHLSPANYGRFLAMFLAGGALLLKRETLDHLLTPAQPELRYAGGWSLEGGAGLQAERLTHNGSNTLWFATARVDRRDGRGYAAITNRGGEQGAAATARLIKALRLPPKQT